MGNVIGDRFAAYQEMPTRKRLLRLGIVVVATLLMIPVLMSASSQPFSDYTERAIAHVTYHHDGLRSCDTKMTYVVDGTTYTHEDSFCGNWHTGSHVRLMYAPGHPKDVEIDFGKSTDQQTQILLIGISLAGCLLLLWLWLPLVGCVFRPAERT